MSTYSHSHLTNQVGAVKWAADVKHGGEESPAAASRFRSSAINLLCGFFILLFKKVRAMHHQNSTPCMWDASCSPSGNNSGQGWFANFCNCPITAKRINYLRIIFHDCNISKY